MTTPVCLFSEWQKSSEISPPYSFSHTVLVMLGDACYSPPPFSSLRQISLFPASGFSLQEDYTVGKLRKEQHIKRKISVINIRGMSSF